MLICREQKNPVEFYGRKITLSEQALNAIYDYTMTPVTDATIGMYIGAKYANTDKGGIGARKIAESLTDEEIAEIAESGIKEEILESSAGKEYWDQFA